MVLTVVHDNSLEKTSPQTIPIANARGVGIRRICCERLPPLFMVVVTWQVWEKNTKGGIRLTPNTHCMQRRPGRGHHDPPLTTNEMGPNPDKVPSRIAQRSLSRVGTIAVFFICILAFTHFMWPTFGTVQVHNYSNADLKAKNYFNTTRVGPNPFAFCPAYSPGDELGTKYGALTLAKSRLHFGTGGRVQRVLSKALAGHPVTISVLGGSGNYRNLFTNPVYLTWLLVSACHGAGDDPISPKCYPSKFFEWWNTVFPHPASELTNGAMRRTNSGYFGYCHSHHLPDATDLVIVELATDDAPYV